MKSVALAIAVGFALSVCYATTPDQDIRDFFKNPDSWGYQISPNGEWLSYLKRSQGRLNIFVRRVYRNESEEKCLTSESKRDILSYFWKGNDRLIYALDRNCDERVHFYSVEHIHDAPPKVQDLTKFPGFPITNIVDQLDNFDNQLLVQSDPQGSGNADVVRLDLVQRIPPQGINPSAKYPPTQQPGAVRRWIADQEGNIRAAVSVEGTNIRLLSGNPTSFEVVKTYDFRHAIDREEQLVVFRAGARPTAFEIGERQLYLAPKVNLKAMRFPLANAPERVVYAISNADPKRKAKALVMVDLKNGSEIGPPLFKNDQFDASGMEIFNGQVACATFLSSERERDCWDGEPNNIYQTIAQQLKLPPTGDIRIIGRDRLEKKLIVVVSSDQNAGQCYLYDLIQNSPKLTFLADRAPQLKGKLAKIQDIEYSSRDKKFKIHGYLTVPIGWSRKERLPLIVLPHGGPWSRDVRGFTRENTEAQFFANCGYAILQVNFRGSIGYGNAFWEAGFKEWGGTMQNDVTDGVLEMIKQGIADPKRIAIVGESYGGYAALAGIAFTRELHYAAAVDRAGISDLVMLMTGFSSDDRIKEMIGDPDKDAQMLAARSPAWHAERIKTPVLIAHGVNDQNVDICQSYEIVAALVRHHAPVEYVEFQEGHLFVNEENRIDYYKAVDRFLKKYLQYTSEPSLSVPSN